MASRWRPKNARPMNLEDEGSLSPGQVPSGMPTSTAAPANKLHALLGHYNSDDEDSENNEQGESDSKPETVPSAPEQQTVPSVWQELWDPQSGQPYYWHTITNELTWDKPQDLLKPAQPAITRPAQGTVQSEAKKLPPANTPIAPAKPPSDANSKNVVTPAAVTVPASKFGPLKEDSKISFKLGPPNNKNSTELVQAKTNGRLTIDADEIIAAIEKEVPPDYQPVVPLFRRRPQQESRPKLGTDFKSFFPVHHRSSVFLEDPASLPAIVTITNTHRGLGYHEKEEEKNPSSSEPGSPKNANNHSTEVKFVAGEILTPMVVPPPPLTLEEKVEELESRLAEPKEEIPLSTWSAQLEVLKDAWRCKKLEASYLAAWVDTKLAAWNEPEKPETKQTVKEPEEPSTEGQDQVIDMVLEDSDNEDSPTSAPSEAIPKPPEELDSALSSFYTDLAELEAATTTMPDLAPAAADEPINEPTPATVNVSNAAGASEATSESDSVNTNSSAVPELVKGIKRTKMSSDMSSLVAKWQKINQSSGT